MVLDYHIRLYSGGDGASATVCNWMFPAATWWIWSTQPQIPDHRSANIRQSTYCSHMVMMNVDETLRVETISVVLWINFELMELNCMHMSPEKFVAGVSLWKLTFDKCSVIINYTRHRSKWLFVDKHFIFVWCITSLFFPFSFNQLCLPEYESMEQFHQMLIVAINEGNQGFGMI